MSKNKSNRPDSYEKATYLEKVSRTNRRLRFGDVTRVAESTGFSSNYVSEVLGGKYMNSKIVNSAYDITRNRMSNVTKLSILEANATA